MKPLATFGDARAAAIDILREGLTDRSEPYAQGASFGRRPPVDRSPERPRLPFVLVALDADVPQYPVNSRATVRITVWHRTSEDAYDLAQLCQGLLCVHSGPVIRNVRPLTGPIPAVDPLSGTDLATFTVAANVRPSAA
ncbi:hypothetical protein ACFY05_42010 [Microtetraspora fusca]|uniref:DUF3168 domain-containing protein n=1 Tax=Microtetraspora fusca TaxID=1997 RepID=A0ABW6VJ70_MICFU